MQGPVRGFRSALPECGRRKLREPTQLDKVLLVHGDGNGGPAPGARDEGSDIPYEMHPSSIEGIPSIYNSDAILSNQSFYVLLPQLEEAEKVVAKFRKEEAEAAKEAAKAQGQPEEPEEEMPRGKRIFVQITSAIAFILLVWAVVAATDWAAQNLWSWLQSCNNSMKKSDTIPIRFNSQAKEW